ncbi:MAG: CHASE2 domain-containing protein, partial [Devosia sp.]
MRRRLLPTLLGLVLVLVLAFIRAADPYPVLVAREITFDLYQRAVPRTGPEGPVRVVDIDERSLAEVGQWPWPRDKLALLTERLARLGAAAIGYDVLFPESDRLSPRRLGESIPNFDASKLPDNDEIFAAMLKQTPAVLGFSSSSAAPPLTNGNKGGFAISGDDPKPSLPFLKGAVAPLPMLKDAAPGLGSLSLNNDDAAQEVRRVPLLWTDGTVLYPGLSLELLRIAL